MSNESNDPRLSKEMQSVAGSVFGIDMKKKHELDFLDDFDSGFDLSAITGIPTKKTPPVAAISVAGASIKQTGLAKQNLDINQQSETSFSDESEVRLNQETSLDADDVDDLEVEFSWDEAKDATSFDEFGFGLDEPETAKPKKKVLKKGKKKTALVQPELNQIEPEIKSSSAKKADKKSTEHKESEKQELHRKELDKKEAVERAETAEADWQAANIKPATTQAKDNFWDPLEEWSWDDNTNQPIGIATAKQDKNPRQEHKKYDNSKHENSKQDKPKHDKPKQDKPKNERPAKPVQEKKVRAPIEERPVAKSRQLPKDDVSFDDHDDDALIDSFHDDEPAGFGVTPGKKLNLNDLLEDWDHNSAPIDDDLELVEDRQETEADDDFEDEYPARKPERAPKFKGSSHKPQRQHFKQDDEDVIAEAYEDEFSDEDFDDADFSFDDEEAPVAKPKRKPEARKPAPRPDDRAREKPRSAREERDSREVKDVPVKPAKKSSAQLSIPTWEEAISIVLEANAHLMTTPSSRPGSRGGSPHYGSSGGGTGDSRGDSRGGNKRGNRGQQRRRKN